MSKVFGAKYYARIAKIYLWRIVLFPKIPPEY